MKSLHSLFIALPILVVGSIAWAEAPPVLLHAWGSQGTHLGQFQHPTGVAFDSEGHIVVGDSDNGRIQMFMPNGDPVELLIQANTPPLEMRHPHSIGADAAGRIYVADCEGGCIWVLDRGGVFVEHWGVGPRAREAYGMPGHIEANAQGHVFLGDWTSHKIHRLDGDGACCAEWIPTTGATFSFTCDSFGHVFVADTDNSKILKYTCSGQYLTEWGGPGNGEGQFHGPLDIACDSKGNVYVADTDNYRIQKFSGQGRFITMWGSHGTGAGQFLKPAGIAIDHDGLIAVTDETAHRVQVFGRPGVVMAHMDIMPGVCPNVLNYEVGGQLQVALLGTDTFDPFQVDPTSVRLRSVAPARFGFGDVSQPASSLANPYACTTAGADGFDDLILTFDADALRAAFGGNAQGAAIRIELTGSMRNGGPLLAAGSMEIVEAPKAAGLGRTAVRLSPRTSTDIDVTFSLPADVQAKLTVHDVCGRRVGVLLDEWSTKGDHTVVWNAGALRSGVYFVRLVAGDQVLVKRYALAR